jgi:hypothetical protein
MAPANQAAAAIPDAMLQKVRTECGARPQEPARPSQQPTIGYQEIARAGRQASGLTDVQYSIFRERVAPFAINGRGGSGLVYMPGELSVLNNSRTALAPYRDLLTRF